MEETDILWVSCRNCCRDTRHEVLAQHVETTDPNEYHEKYTWQIVRCLGCQNCCFRLENQDFEIVHEVGDGEYEPEVTVSIYPSAIAGHKPLKEGYWLPPLIRKIYQQTLKALGEKAYVLASIGLRASIEAVCNHLKVSGNNLEKRIDQLFKGGYVSNGDKRRLHAIRFLGNDAAHEIAEPDEKDIGIALEIVEHLLNSVFILEKRARRLDTVAETFEDFIRLITSAAKAYEGSSAVSLTALLGKKRRLVGQSFDEYEDMLIDNISSGAIKFLKLTHVEEGSGKKTQFYEIDLAEARKPQGFRIVQVP